MAFNRAKVLRIMNIKGTFVKQFGAIIELSKKNSMKKTIISYSRLLTLVEIAFILMLIVPVSGNAQNNGMITSLGNGIIHMNWGTVDGMESGIVLDVFREENVIHMATGERLGSNEKHIGKIEIIESQQNSSTASTLDYSELFQIGDKLKVSYDEMVLSGSIVQAPERGIITNVDNTLLTFNMGRFDGVERNIYFDIFRDEGVTYHPVTGAPVDPRRAYIGRLVVTDVQDEYSIGQMIAQERDIVPGDKVELSLLQPSDLETFSQQRVSEPQFDRSQQSSFNVSASEPVQVGPPENIVGTVTRVSERDLFFIWRADYEMPVGRVFSIFRRIEIPHPESKGVIVDDPLIQIGTATLRESIGKLGKAFVASADTDILPNDFIGLAEGTIASMEQVITSENAQQVYSSQRRDILEAAQDLTSQVNQLQSEMYIVRNALDKLDRIDRELMSQRELSRRTNESLESIKMMMMNEGFALEGFELPPSQASIERLEYPGSKTNHLRLDYSDDVGVEFQLVGNRLMVTLDVDSTGLMSLAQPSDTVAAQQKAMQTGPGVTIESGEEDVEEGSFFTSIFGIITIILVLLAVAGGLYFFILKKKMDGGASGDDEEESDDEDLEEDGIEEETEEVEEEVEEEIGSFEDDDDD